MFLCAMCCSGSDGSREGQERGCMLFPCLCAEVEMARVRARNVALWERRLHSEVGGGSLEGTTLTPGTQVETPSHEL